MLFGCRRESSCGTEVSCMRVLQVGLGDLGRRIAADLRISGRGEIVAAVDPAEELAGRRLASLVAGAPADVTVRPDLDSVGSWSDIDAAIVATSSRLPECEATFRQLLSRGLPVVSTCEELTWPWLRNEDLARALDAEARRHDARLLGTGVNPGFLMDALPAFLSTTCVIVEGVSVERVIDASTRRAAFQRKVGAGLAVPDVEAGLAGARLGHVGLPESLHLLAHHAGLDLDDWEEDGVPVLARTELASELGPVQAGRAAGVRQAARGLRLGVVVAELVFEAVLGAEHPRDRIVIRGEPGLDLVIAGGVHGDVATSAIVIHAVAALREAPAGLHSTATLPLLGRSICRPA